jgi:vancomycin resistance protein YoaR
VDERKPRLTYAELSAVNGIISSFSTQFNRNDVDRTDNIKLACSRIDNKILLPGESFSMNSALGPRTQDNGYKEAPIIFKNELVPGTGGGVCQVSSTLYNTVLLAGLDVIERTHHSMPLTYISPGRDATINEGSIDFRFVNDSKYPVVLDAYVSGSRLYISLLGNKNEDGLVIKLKTQTIGVYKPKPDEVVLDYTLPYGQKVVERKAVKGLRVVVYREAYKNGSLEWREKLSEDYYKPIQGIIRVSSDQYLPS